MIASLNRRGLQQRGWSSHSTGMALHAGFTPSSVVHALRRRGMQRRSWSLRSGETNWCACRPRRLPTQRSWQRWRAKLAPPRARSARSAPLSRRTAASVCACTGGPACMLCQCASAGDSAWKVLSLKGVKCGAEAELQAGDACNGVLRFWPLHAQSPAMRRGCRDSSPRKMPS